MPETTHYVILIDIKRVTKKETTTVAYTSTTQAEPERIIDDLTHVVIKADSLGTAIDKTIGHLELEFPNAELSNKRKE
jgi:hypothetical protein